MMNRALRMVQDPISSYATADSENLAQCDYFLGEMSRAAYRILRGQCQDTPEALQSLSVQVSLRCHTFAVDRVPEPAMQMCSTSYLFHGRNRLCSPMPVVWIRQASSAFEETSACATEPFSWLCPSSSQLRHRRSAGPALSLHHPHLPHPPHCQKLQDHSHCLP